MAEELVLDAEKAARDAKRLFVMTAILAAVVAAVTLIDQGIKRSILREAENTRLLLATLRERAAKQDTEVVADGGEAAGEAGSPAGPGLNGSSGVDHDPAAGAAVAEAARPAKRPAAKRPARTASRAPGDG